MNIDLLSQDLPLSYDHTHIDQFRQHIAISTLNKIVLWIMWCERLNTNIRRLDLGSNCLTGTIPEDFLERTDPDAFEYVGLEYNKLTGKIPRITAFIHLDDDDMSLHVVW